HLSASSISHRSRGLDSQTLFGNVLVFAVTQPPKGGCVTGERGLESPAALCQTTSRSKSASSRGIVIIAQWLVGNCRRRHPASVGGSALGANMRRMSERKKLPPVQAMWVRGFADTIAGFFR